MISALLGILLQLFGIFLKINYSVLIFVFPVLQEFWVPLLWKIIYFEKVWNWESQIVSVTKKKF